MTDRYQIPGIVELSEDDQRAVKGGLITHPGTDDGTPDTDGDTTFGGTPKPRQLTGQEAW